MNFIFVSSWAHGNEPGGLSQFTFDPETGNMTYVASFDQDAAFNVSFLNQDKNLLYVLDESSDLPGMRLGGGGRIFTYRLNPETGACEKLSETPTYCANPANLSLDETGKYLLVANHGARNCATKIKKDENGSYYPYVVFDDATMELFSVNEDGSIGELLDVVKHYGDGPDPKKQLLSHPHSATRSPSGNLFAVCDKGSDRVYMYKIDKTANKLTEATRLQLAAGTLPRYCVFHPTQPFFYHNNEKSMDVCAYRYDEEGHLIPIDSKSSLPAGHEPAMPNYEQQGFCIDASGRFLYDVLHGPEMVSVFSIDQEDGTLQLIQSVSLPYAWPRGAALSPDGRFLAVACLGSGKVLIFSVGEDGLIHKTRWEADVSDAAYVTFWRN